MVVDIPVDVGISSITDKIDLILDDVKNLRKPFEIVTHTSNKTWAQRAYEQLLENDNIPGYVAHDVVKASRYSRKRKVNA